MRKIDLRGKMSTNNLQKKSGGNEGWNTSGKIPRVEEKFEKTDSSIGTDRKIKF